VHFSQKQQDGFAPKFFSRLRRKHLFITTCIEKQCTQALNLIFSKATFTDLQNFLTFSLACLFYFTFGPKSFADHWTVK